MSNKEKQDGVLREKTCVSEGKMGRGREKVGQHDDRLNGRSTFSKNGK